MSTYWKKLFDNCEVECGRLRALNAELLEALEFYGNPETYAAIAFLPDPPCGEFIHDFSDDHGHELLPGYRPGKRARAAMVKQYVADNFEAAALAKAKDES